jgi:hypothetical protein
MRAPCSCPVRGLFISIQLLFLLVCQFIWASSATSNFNPPTGDWNTAANWMPNTVPNGASEVATFSTSNRTHVSFSQVTEVDSIVFKSGGNAFTIMNAPFHTVTISGTGVVNNSGQTQQIVPDMGSGAPSRHPDSPAFPSIVFSNSATAGTNVVYTSNGGARHGP